MSCPINCGSMCVWYTTNTLGSEEGERGREWGGRGEREREGERGRERKREKEEGREGEERREG